MGKQSRRKALFFLYIFIGVYTKYIITYNFIAHNVLLYIKYFTYNLPLQLYTWACYLFYLSGKCIQFYLSRHHNNPKAQVAKEIGIITSPFLYFCVSIFKLLIFFKSIHYTLREKHKTQLVAKLVTHHFW